MTIYEHKTSMTTSGSTVSTMTLPIRGGLCRFVYIKANTATTVFRANLQDEDGDNILDWGFSTGMLNETGIAVPVSGRHTLQITNVSAGGGAAGNDTFKIKIRVQE